jgi:hypothetical protein
MIDLLKAPDIVKVAERVIELTATITPWRMPLILAAFAECTLNLAEVPRGVAKGELATLLACMQRKKNPNVVLIGDDDLQSSGPAGFDGVEKLVKWARAIILHAAGGEVEHYQEAVKAAAIRRRVLFIETSAAQQGAWKSFIDAHRHSDASALLLFDPEGHHPRKPTIH